MDDVRVRKRKTILRLIGITIGVYLTFRYLLPVVIPFLLGAALAVFLRKPYLWLCKRAKLPKSVAATFVTVLLTALLGGVCFFLVREIIYQGGNLIQNIPGYADAANVWVREFCEACERKFKLEDGEVFDWLNAQWNNGVAEIGSLIVSGLLNNSVALVGFTVKVGTGAVVVFLATVLFLMYWEYLGRAAASSPFREEIFNLKNKLLHAGGAYIKSQLIVMTLTALVCCIGLTLLGNPYSILFGVGIGLLDALPLFGTGTVFIPWILIEAVRGEWLRAVILAVIYLITYFIREILETRIMGNSMGLNALESLAAIYVGLRLFGIIGVVLGPFGVITIRELYGFDESKGK